MRYTCVPGSLLVLHPLLSGTLAESDVVLVYVTSSIHMFVPDGSLNFSSLQTSAHSVALSLRQLWLSQRIILYVTYHMQQYICIICMLTSLYNIPYATIYIYIYRTYVDNKSVITGKRSFLYSVKLLCSLWQPSCGGLHFTIQPNQTPDQEPLFQKPFPWCFHVNEILTKDMHPLSKTFPKSWPRSPVFPKNNPWHFHVNKVLTEDHPSFKNTTTILGVFM